MIRQTLILFGSLAIVQAGVIGTHFSPATSVSTVYSSVNDGLKTYASPAPVYESVVSTQETRSKAPDGTQQTTVTKSLDTGYSSVKKFDTRITNDGAILTHTVPTVYSTPLHTPILYNPYTATSPIVTNSISPITYTTHTNSAPLVKTFTPGLTYAAHSPILQAQPVKTTLTYSEAPLVSHMTFTGLGAAYSW